VPTFLIDGYNLLHAAGFAGAGKASRFKHTRNRFLNWIADAGPVKAGTACVRIIFDAQNGAGDPREQPYRGLFVRFAFQQTADDLIETLLAAETTPASVAVVSNDSRLREAARRRGAASWTCEAFIDWLETGSPGPGVSAAPSPAIPEKPDGPTPAEEAAALLAAFGLPKTGSPRRRP
jgi:predicted RNA-binding protein with PIN domain